MINVTKPFLPDIAEYTALLEGIWQRGWLTNHGPLVTELESKLKDFLGVEHLLYLSNGTIAIQIAIKALELTGEIITTPFSYVATTSSIVWEQCTPVFADIDPETLNISPACIEPLITPRTTAILATHVYGNPCDIGGIEQIAKKHNLKVIYDAAHCFGSKYRGKSVYGYGDVSTASFHATKLFHTIEGGAVFTPNASVHQKMSYLRNFGHDGPEAFADIGINGKNSEFHAAMGLVNLRHIEAIMVSRKQQCLFYDQKLKGMPLLRPRVLPEAEPNYSYYPLVFESEEQLLHVVKTLNAGWIYPRRYFYPSLNTLHYVQPQATPVSEDISKRVLCLPLYHSLSAAEQEMIVKWIEKAMK